MCFFNFVFFKYNILNLTLRVVGTFFVNENIRATMTRTWKKHIGPRFFRLKCACAEVAQRAGREVSFSSDMRDAVMSVWADTRLLVPCSWSLFGWNRPRLWSKAAAGLSCSEFSLKLAEEGKASKRVLPPLFMGRRQQRPRLIPGN